MERLVVEEGPDKGRHLEIGPAGSARIGRDPAVDLFLRDLRASHAHARIERRADGVWLVDLHSRNGTFVNDVPIRERKLQPGDHIHIGDTRLRWVVETGAPAHAPAGNGSASLANRLQAFYKDHRDVKAVGSLAAAGVRRIIAFEIDGTLLTTEGVALEALEQSLREMGCMSRPFEGCPTAGRTEMEIVRNALRAAGLPPDRIRTERSRVLSRYVSYLGNALSRRTPGRVLPGATALLNRLNALGGSVVSPPSRAIQPPRAG
jgi:phosphoglycolate phosphatase-like HAD superfamily hydrolase